MLIKKIKDQVVVQTESCGTIIEVLRNKEYKHFDFAIAEDIKPTLGHYHKTFEEIYFLMDGEIKIELFDPENKKRWVEELTSNELLVIDKNIHHKIIECSAKNRLGVICVPYFELSDEIESDILSGTVTKL